MKSSHMRPFAYRLCIDCSTRQYPAHMWVFVPVNKHLQPHGIILTRFIIRSLDDPNSGDEESPDWSEGLSMDCVSLMHNGVPIESHYSIYNSDLDNEVTNRFNTNPICDEWVYAKSKIISCIECSPGWEKEFDAFSKEIVNVGKIMPQFIWDKINAVYGFAIRHTAGTRIRYEFLGDKEFGYCYSFIKMLLDSMPITSTWCKRYGTGFDYQKLLHYDQIEEGIYGMRMDKDPFEQN